MGLRSCDSLSLDCVYHDENSLHTCMQPMQVFMNVGRDKTSTDGSYACDKSRLNSIEVDAQKVQSNVDVFEWKLMAATQVASEQLKELLN